MKILVASSIDKDALQTLEDKHNVTKAFNANEAKLRTIICNQEVLIFRSGISLNREILAAAKKLRLIIRAGSGLDNIDLAYLKQQDIPLKRIPGPGAVAVAEMSFALMLSLARQIVVADTLLRKGRWAKNELDGHLLTGKTLGIIGAGNIGTRVGGFGKAWGMNILGCVESPASINGKHFRDHGFDLVDMETVLKTSDFVSIHVPLKETTRNLISSKELSFMKDGSFLVNLARGGVLDESALYQYLTQPGGLAGAALDVHNQEGEGKISPLSQLTNIVLTPHIGAMTIDSQRQIGQHILRIIAQFN
ncbi:MAG: hydroxyacid dehydrogenase [Candidatus Scalindua sp. AMX11]|nr:MAG: hydroxyacid dehydrogenase [Candidatus Scalindua sp.]NOG83491.1 hydroxyacid dehydrogenase [Planctomycetota bacterium]RZV72894.1 MAG: hydroxyacid dehydrogenase [Candidatus Scalindua sp. SCAELEC01]TDE64808.1 MAG: hydroxyacid dehydrogenase [Candidatus Scalindua sp. AMX11]GJQ59810.1 MAG: hypothetical protein SCALA701_26110 [Candidatus Scalindua sp.]